MKLTLMIEGSAQAIMAVLANLPNDGSVGITPVNNDATQIKPIVPPMPPSPSVVGDDDESGPVNIVAPGAVDSSGIPWDERIHSANKAVVGDGTWRKRRGADPELTKQVEAELRARTPAPQVMPVQPPMPVPPPVPLAAPAPMPVVPPIVPPMPPPEPIAPVQVTPPAPPIAGQYDFQQFMAHLQTKFTQRGPDGTPLVTDVYLAQLTAEVSAAFAPHGHAPLTVITDIATDPNKINYVVQLMQRDGKW